MLHSDRVHVVEDVADAEALAEKLAEHTWCACNGFRLDGYLYLNDSTGPDGAQEFAVFKEATGHQVESITFGWCSKADALGYIRAVSAGEYDGASWPATFQLDASRPHRCGHCA